MSAFIGVLRSSNDVLRCGSGPPRLSISALMAFESAWRYKGAAAACRELVAPRPLRRPERPRPWLCIELGEAGEDAPLRLPRRLQVDGRAEPLDHLQIGDVLEVEQVLDLHQPCHLERLGDRIALPRPVRS